MSRAGRTDNWESGRMSQRIHNLREISIDYEGYSEHVPIRPPDISAHGMFINTSRRFPEGAILKLRFRLAISGKEIETRSEVRYCLPGVGVGVEFIRIPIQAVRAIEREIKLSAGPGRTPRRTRWSPPSTSPTRAR